jgi:hypothetical protein
MDKQERDYIEKVKSILSKGKGAVEVIDELATLKQPDLEGLQLNTTILIGEITDLEFERNDGELEMAGDDNETYEEAELRVATALLNNIKAILADAEKENWYKLQAYAIKIAYSRLEKDNYLYEVIEKAIDPTTPEEAEKLLVEMKPTIPKEHPDKPGFGLEYAEVLARTVDSNGKVVQLKYVDV